MLTGVVGVARCVDADLDALLDRSALEQIDLVVVACNGDADAGHRVCRSVRATTPTMLAMLTSSTREADELLAFARGCDDYITTSSSPEVIRARLVGLVARSGRRRADRVVEFGTLTVDPSQRAATVRGTPVALTRTEFDLLHALVAGQRRVISRGELLEAGWSGCAPSDHVLDVHLSRLRRKILQAGGPKIGVPVPGVGYRVGSSALPGGGFAARPSTPTAVRALAHLHPADVDRTLATPTAAWA